LSRRRTTRPAAETFRAKTDRRSDKVSSAGTRADSWCCTAGRAFVRRRACRWRVAAEPSWPNCRRCASRDRFYKSTLRP
jgi:hypothetical protein